MAFALLRVASLVVAWGGAGMVAGEEVPAKAGH